MQALEFFFFAILIGAITLIFAVMTIFYKYVDIPNAQNDKPENDERTGLISEENKEHTEDVFKDKHYSVESLP